MLIGQGYTMRSWRATASACLLEGERIVLSRRLNLARSANSGQSQYATFGVSCAAKDPIPAKESLPELIMEQLLAHSEQIVRVKFPTIASLLLHTRWPEIGRSY
jgi:hypothetical protein